ncbi:PKD domain-containing protein [Fodinibius saliphilus]|uniref:PKD domain-containing protein n=1 Tax=Fodinibius saliphilus TaxID=1920650 RepID=UPI00148633FB|nr:PKD domain-containing protein [Fodinibius saliphilus]
MIKQDKLYWIIPVLLLLVSACEPQVTSAPDLGNAPKSEDVTFESTPNSENPNVVTFTSTTEGFKFLWDFGNGSTAEGKEVQGEFPLKGEYTVTLTAFTEAGQALNTKKVEIAQTNYAMLDDPNLNMLTGGIDATNGKTWVVDSTQFGHMGLGSIDHFAPQWWQAAPEAKANSGLYNDRYTFKLEGFSYEMETNGDVFLNSAYGDEFENTTVPPSGADLMAPWTAPADQTFNLIEAANGDLTLKVSSPTFIGFYAGTQTYQILELTENTMKIRYEDTKNGFSWYHSLITEGYEHPIEPLPYKSEELTDNFDEEGNVNWTKDQIANFVEGYDNPAPVGVNTSAKVAKYKKGEAQWDNVYIDLGYELNLNERSTVKLKAYFPSYNDYVTEDPNAPDWAPNKSLDMQVEVKLHNVSGATGLGGNAWQTQETVIKQVADTDTWVELEFDFSSVSDREDFDRIVIQLGGEGHSMPGLFFIDDFQLIE